MQSQESVIHFEDVDLIYPNGFQGLKKVTLDVKAGEFVAIIGGSGAGKSTLLRAINRTVAITGRKADVLEFDLLTIKAKQFKHLRREIGFIFQQFNLVKNLTALDNVKHGRLAYVGTLRSLFNFYPQHEIELAKETLNSVGLDKKHNARCDELSGGQQQRVAIARAMVQQPKIILADEPMASLDPKLSERVLELLQKFNREKNMTTIVNMHVLEHARKYANRVIGMREGHVVFDGPPAGLSQGTLDAIYEGAQS
jgi:phosphonate transport system ATP-binding protein